MTKEKDFELEFVVRVRDPLFDGEVQISLEKIVELFRMFSMSIVSMFPMFESNSMSIELLMKNRLNLKKIKIQ